MDTLRNGDSVTNSTNESSSSKNVVELSPGNEYRFEVPFESKIGITVSVLKQYK